MSTRMNRDIKVTAFLQKIQKKILGYLIIFILPFFFFFSGIFLLFVEIVYGQFQIESRVPIYILWLICVLCFGSILWILRPLWKNIHKTDNVSRLYNALNRDDDGKLLSFVQLHQKIQDDTSKEKYFILEYLDRQRNILFLGNPRLDFSRWRFDRWKFRALISGIIIYIIFLNTLWFESNQKFFAQKFLHKILIEQKEPFYIKDIDISYKYPAYLDREEEKNEGTNGNIQVPAGTQITLQFSLPDQIKKGIIFRNNKSEPLAQDGNYSFEYIFIADQNETYFFEIEFALGGKKREEKQHTISVTSDAAPLVEITDPKEDVHVDSLDSVSIQYNARDDNGIKNIYFLYQINDSELKQKQISIFETTKSNIQQTSNFDLYTLEIEPGQTLTVFVAAKDGDPFHPEKEGRSKPVKIFYRDPKQIYQKLMENEYKIREAVLEYYGDHFEDPFFKWQLQQSLVWNDTFLNASFTLHSTGERIISELESFNTEMKNFSEKERNSYLSASYMNLEKKLKVLAGQHFDGIQKKLLLSISTLHTKIQQELEDHLKLLLNLTNYHAAENVKEGAKNVTSSVDTLLEQLNSNSMKNNQHAQQEYLEKSIKEIKKQMQNLFEMMQNLQTHADHGFVNKEAAQNQNISDLLEQLQQAISNNDLEKAKEILLKLQQSLKNTIESMEELKKETENSEYSQYRETAQKLQNEIETITQDQKDLIKKTEKVIQKHRDNITKEFENIFKKEKVDLLELAYTMLNHIYTVNDNNTDEFFLSERNASIETSKKLIAAMEQKWIDEMLPSAYEAHQAIAVYKKRHEDFRLPNNDDLSQSYSISEKIISVLKNLRIQTNDTISEAERQNLRQLSQEQDQLQKKLQYADQSLASEIPILPPQLREEIKKAEEQMKQAKQHLQNMQSESGKRFQVDAHETLQKIQSDFFQGEQGFPMQAPAGQQLFKPPSLSDGRDGNSSDGEGPKVQQNNETNVFRKNILQGLKSKPVPLYKKEVKEYYKGLLN